MVLTRQDTVKELRVLLEKVLGVNGLNQLGTYELMRGTKIMGVVPSIYVRYPLNQETVVRRIKDKGIECVIDSEPMVYMRKHKFRNNRGDRYYQIILDQHHPTIGLTEAVEAIATIRRLNIIEQPVIRPAQQLEGNKGVIPARAILYCTQAHFI